VPAAGGRPIQLLTTPAEDVKLGRTGQFLLYHDKKGGENPCASTTRRPSRATSGIHDTKAGTHRKITTFAGEDRSPVFTDGDRAFYYLSEDPAASTSQDGHRRRQVAAGHVVQGLPVRFLSLSDTGTLCFGYDGELYTR